LGENGGVFIGNLVGKKLPPNAIVGHLGIPPYLDFILVMQYS
jgi:hypothetical protein